MKHFFYLVVSNFPYYSFPFSRSFFLLTILFPLSNSSFCVVFPFAKEHLCLCFCWSSLLSFSISCAISLVFLSCSLQFTFYFVIFGFFPTFIHMFLVGCILLLLRRLPKLETKFLVHAGKHDLGFYCYRLF